MTDLPLVTIGIPTYNRSGYLRQALQSALAQTYPNLEIIVSDNASTDDTPQVIAEYTDPRIRFIRQPENLGMAGNWNACLRAATGEYFLLLSDDDLLVPTGIEALVSAYVTEGQKQPISFCYGDVTTLSMDGAGAPPTLLPSAPRRQPWTDFIVEHHQRQIALCATLYKLTPEVRSRGYATNYRVLADWDFYLKIVLSEKADVIHVNESVGVYRMHAASESNANGRVRWAAELLWLLDLCLSALKATNSEDSQIKNAEARLIRNKFEIEVFSLDRPDVKFYERVKKIRASAVKYSPPPRLLLKKAASVLLPPLLKERVKKIYRPA